MKKGYIAVSPMLRVDPPRTPPTEMVPLTPVQTAHLLDTATRTGDPLAPLWTLAAYTGARKGELLGLLWSDLDPDAGRPTIRPNVVRDIKTARSRRTLGDAYADRGLVFASEIGTPLDPNNVCKRFKRALAAAGLPTTTRMYDLRHGAATMLLEAGEPVPDVSEYLGHASPAVTMAVYAHAVPDAGKRAADRLGAIIGGARGEAETPTGRASAAG